MILPRSRRLSRRSFLATSAAGIAGLGLAACGTNTSAATVTRSSRLRVVNWPEYIPLASVDTIAGELGFEIAYDEIYEDNVSGFSDIIEPALTSGGNPDFDLVVPTNWLAAQMIDDGWVEELPLELIPNHINIDPVYLTNDFDRGSRFQMPWQGGITGIAFDPEQTNGPVTSIEQLFDAELAGRVGLVGEMREAVGLAMLLNGDDPSRPTPSTARAGLRVITDLVERGHFAAIVFDDFVGLLSDGQLAATMAWSGQAAALQFDRPDLGYAIPDEGGISWFDTMVIPRGASNIAGAAQWMNWAYNPDNAAEISAFNLYVSPVLGTREALRRRGGDDAELADNPLIFPDADTRNRLFTWGTLDSETERQIEAEFDSLFAFFE